MKSAPEGSRIVRMGGDEFLMLAAIPADSPEPAEMGEKIDAGIDEYNNSHSNPYSVGVSYGWVSMPLKEDMTNLDEYIEIADAKMYEMKMKKDKYRRD